MAFTTTRRLNFGDCDPSGIAYFPSYLNILVGVYEEFFGVIGFPWPELIKQRRLGLPTVTLHLTFNNPGLHGDLMEFEVTVVRLGRTSVDLDHVVKAEGRTLWLAQQRLVLTSHDTTKAIPWPDDIREALTLHLETSNAHDPSA
ncbi:4-hydroxybenzoyl-CoA thioesterase [Pseudorhizobium tarimense]|uniref:4-hydroxybenzoyl-CoA thioesterase n=1 Tax=Pseudorhizobium tarimense TaxID=1079109 RepID=A0ABV2H8G1_9HYPH|nr:thioesterase family protein [Pseudorhizobium tarimense]MCJ8519972.1 acyl-CoA thioesterase [Pseudorhizobium tarimense]